METKYRALLKGETIGRFPFRVEIKSNDEVDLIEIVEAGIKFLGRCKGTNVSAAIFKNDKLIDISKTKGARSYWDMCGGLNFEAIINNQSLVNEIKMNCCVNEWAS